MLTHTRQKSLDPSPEGVAPPSAEEEERREPSPVRPRRFHFRSDRRGVGPRHSYRLGGSPERRRGTPPKKAVPAPPDEEEAAPSANDSFKKAFGALFWSSLILATGAHFAIFAFWPDMTAEVISYSSDELTAIVLPPEIDIPEAPQAISRPAVPVIATGNIDEDITIAPTTFESNPVSELPPPPSLEEVSPHELAQAPTFTPYTVKPEIRNRDEIRHALEREYPPLLRDAGIGGTVLVWFFIDEEGQVVNTQINQSSGQKALDDAALKVADIIQFTPALNREKRVPVWISLPITFMTRTAG